MHTLPNTRSQNTDDALVPSGVIERHGKQRGITLQIDGLQLCQCVLLHGLLDIPSLPIELMQFFSKASR